MSGFVWNSVKLPVMAQHDVQVVLHHTMGLPEDDYVNHLHFEVNSPDTLEGLCDGINAAYATNLNAVLSQAVNGMTVKCYAPGLNPTGPEFQKSYTTPTGAGGAAPPQIAICMSYATVDDPDASTPRRRGRIYLGPLGPGLDEKVPSGHRNSIIAFGQAIGAVGTASNTTWLMKSQTDNSYHKIESIWVDDSFDVIRRRKLKPTVRQTADVQ